MILFNFRSLFKCTFLVGGLLISGCCTDGVRREIRTLPKEQWIGMLEGIFDNVTVRINNYTPNDHEYEEADERAFYKPNDSFFRVDTLGVDLVFDIPVVRNDPYSLYINDINSSGLVPDTRSGRALIAIIMEDDGYEVIGNCVDNIACICGDPRVNMNELQIDILLTFGTRAGNLTITEITVDMTSTFDEEGPCRDNACAFICDLAAPDRENIARERIEEEISQHFMDNRTVLELLFNRHIDSLGVTEDITSATISSSGDLILTVEYEDDCGG